MASDVLLQWMPAANVLSQASRVVAKARVADRRIHVVHLRHGRKVSTRV